MSKTGAVNAEPLNWKTALQQILDSTAVSPPAMVSIQDGLGKICAQDSVSSLLVPPFDNSSMDGFAVRADDVAKASWENPIPLTVIGEAPAGRPFTGTIAARQSVEIMTGAPLPVGADSVVRVEDTNRPSALEVEIQTAVKAGTAVRRAGADTALGDTVVTAGQVISPAQIALAASCGVHSISVYPAPSVAIAVGGDEVISIYTHSELLPGQIFDSNSPMLLSLLKSWGLQPDFLGRMPDNPNAMVDFFRRGMQYDILLTVGGVSMGEHDYVRQCLTEIGAREQFWKINQQPGGPMLFATAGRTLIFGLPGNPVSAYVCADIYFKSALRKAMGHLKPAPIEITAELTEPLKKPHRKVAFVRGQLQNTPYGISARSTGPQDSNRIRSLIGHDGYILFPEEKQELSAGEQVTFLVTDEAALGRAISRRD